MFFRRVMDQKNPKLYFVLIVLCLISALFLYNLPIFSFNYSQVKISNNEISQQAAQFGEDELTKQNVQNIPRRTVNVTNFEINVNSQGDAFNGYNLFVVDPASKTGSSKCNNTLLITDMDGNIIKRRNVDFGTGTINAEFINSTTLLIGENTGAVLWNIYTNTFYCIGVKGHHEYEYNPNDNTIFTFDNYDIDIDGTYYRFDYINEYNLTGHLIWSLDTRSFISITQWCPFEDMVGKNVGITHSNTIFFDAEEDIFYYNPRNLNTFYKIDHNTGEVIWGLGQYGDFTLFDIQGNKQESLFFHPHAVEKIDDDQFILFDNDLHNFVNPYNKISRIVELKIDETTMTANESWVWLAPPDYYSSALGDADRLPNGNRLGTFGTAAHPDTNIGARLVEVNNEGEIVWEMNFPHTESFKHDVNRMERFRFSPIISSPPDITALPDDNVRVTWQTWYNFRAKKHMNGSYALYLDDVLIESGSHIFDKFWRPNNLTFDIGQLESRNYNLTLTLVDEAEHVTTDSINIFVSESSTAIAPSVNSFLLGLGFLIALRKKGNKKC